MDAPCVSVPSSSGNKLRLDEWPGADGPMPMFQSPPHRGTNCDCPSATATPAHIHVSVPSSSGNKLRRSGSRPIRAGSSRFSPLLIGEQTATQAAMSAWSRRIPFQSPPHRGTNCDRDEPAHRDTRWHRVSVPSSSGNKLRHCVDRGASNNCSFSPLLIGEQTATQIGRADRIRRLIVSVPSSSGNKLRRSQDWRTAARSSGFSPLLIGEQTATRGRAELGVIASLSVSVPSSSGNKLRLRDAVTRGPSGVWFQSPPHRGTNCDDATSAGPLMRVRVSVPSSSGNKLRLHARERPRSPCTHVSVPSSSGNKLRLSGHRAREHRGVRFQSPPHRGTNCDFCLARHRARSSRFQSPPHRGTNCDAPPNRSQP